MILFADNKANWLEMVRRKVKCLKFKEQSMKKYFQLDNLPIHDGLLNALMNDYLKSWPNVERIEMDWIGTTSISDLPASTNFKQLWNLPCLNYLQLKKNTSSNPGPINTHGVAFNGNSVRSWSSSSYSISTCISTFRF